VQILQKQLIGSFYTFLILYLPQKSKTRSVKFNGSNRMPSVPKYKLKVKESIATGKHAGELFDVIYSIRFYII
jgi:hypothetical protein